MTKIRTHHCADIACCSVPQDVNAAEAVVAAVDANALAVYLAQKTPEEGPGAEKRKKEFDEQARNTSTYAC